MTDQVKDERTKDDLAVLLRTGREILIAGKVVNVRPIPMRQLSPFARAVLPLVQNVMPGAGDGQPDFASVDLAKLNWLELVMWHGPDCILAVSLATGEPEEWVGDLDPAEMVLLLAEVVRVNADFFVQRLAPAMKEALRRVTGIAAAAADGLTPSSGSSAPATTAAT